MRIWAICALWIATAQAPVAPVADPHRPAPTHDTVAPALPTGLRSAVLIVSKTNGWRHLEHIPHSNAVLAQIARSQGRASFVTENAAVFDDALLARFAVVVLNSASGDFLSEPQQAAFRRFVERGGGVVALHAAGDGSHSWPWYRATIIGADYAGHPGAEDQFQWARVTVEAPQHPVLRGVAPGWAPVDEWYSYKSSPRDGGMTILAGIDEASYRPGAGRVMGRDHPVLWVNTRAGGRIVYSSIGHTAEAYDDPRYRRILANAIRWAAR